MKHLLLGLVMFSALNAAAVDTTPRHRHQHVDDAVQVQQVDTAYEAVEAYSDTTTYEAYDDAVAQTDSTAVNSVNPADYNDPFSFYNALWTVGAGGVIIAILLTLLLLIFIIAPIIIVVLLIRYLFKRQNDRVMLREKEIERNYSRAEYQSADYEKVRDDYMWKRGIQNVALGLGLVLMFGCWGAEALVGVGLLVMCFGIGQMVIARTVPGGRHKQDRGSGLRQDSYIPGQNSGRNDRPYDAPNGQNVQAGGYYRGSGLKQDSYVPGQNMKDGDKPSDAQVGQNPYDGKLDGTKDNQ